MRVDSNRARSTAARLQKTAIAMAVTGALMGASPALLAQSNAVGTIFGTAAEEGSKIVITNVDTGAVRTATVGSDGRFQVPALPVGNYKAELQKDGKTVATKDGIVVTIGSGSEVSFDENVAEVVVTGSATPVVDVSSTDTRSVFTAEQLQKLTVKQSIEEVALLAPGTVRGDSRYNTNRGQPSASFGGAGANENAFYINGYAVTDPIKGLGSSSLPFLAIDQYQLLTGGYGAEFGRSTGGVVNIVTKSGSNKWEAGGMVTYTPSSLTANNPDIYYPKNGTARDGLLWNQGSERETDSLVYSAYVGGPIVKDKLFFFLAGEMENRTTDGPANFTGAGTAVTDGPNGWHDRDIDVPRWLAKLDWNISEGRTLELTAVSDVRKETRKQYGYYYPGGTAVPTNPDNPDYGLNTLEKGSHQNGGYDFRDGGNLYIAKYTEAFTDNLILTALFGQQENDHKIFPYGYDPSVVSVRDNRSNVENPLYFGSYQTINDPTAFDKTRGYRLDLEWLAGRHDVRVGYDVQNLKVEDGVVTSGPGYGWIYEHTDTPDDPIQGGGGAVGPGGNGDYVDKFVTANGGTFETEQYAYFIEDRWQIADNVLVSLGLRNENFKNYNSDHVVFLDQTDQWAPRLGASWDVFGDSSLRVFGNLGRYHLAIPLNVAFRQVGGSTNTDEYFAFDSIDPNTGEPIGLRPLGDGPYAANNEYGQARDPKQAAALSLKSYYQDELVLGLEAELFEDFKGGARYIYRKLGNQIDDNCDGRPAYNWAVENGYGSGIDAEDLVGGGDEPNGLDDGAEAFWLQLAECRIINPGKSNTLRFVDAEGNYVDAKISAEQFGLPKLKRDYQGVDLFLEHPFRDKWYAKVDFTISASKGNAEGMLYSDSGQQDVAVTANWDHPELMQNADGYLPNDRRFQIKAFGFYEITNELRVSATLTSLSGRPKAPAGYYGGDEYLHVEALADSPYDDQYYFENYVAYPGPYYHYVLGQPSPRGESRLPWTTVLDLGMTYAPNLVSNRLKFGVDVFNVFNTLKPQSIQEYYENPQGTVYHSGGKVLSYNAPRSVRFTVRYDWAQ